MKPIKLLFDDKGMTLVELMVTIGIVAVLMGTVVFGVGSNIGENNLRAAARQLESVMKEAKLYAYEKGVSHSLVFSADGREYKMFRDTDGDRIPDTGESVLRTIVLNQGISISNNTFAVNGSGLNAVQFDSRGRPSGLGTVTFHASNGTKTTQVVVNLMGSMRLQ